MTNNELKKLNEIKDDIDSLQRSFEIIKQAPEGKNQVSLRTSGYDHCIEVKRVPGLSDNLRYMAIEIIGDRIDDLERQMMSLVLCTVEQGSPVYSPAKITDETK